MIDYDFEKLEFLRKNTKLSIKDKIIIGKINKNEYEYILRYKKWQEKMLVPWKRFGDGLEFEEFCNKIIIDNLELKKEKKLLKENK